MSASGEEESLQAETDTANDDGSPETEHGVTYVVQKGDTLARITQACAIAGLQITIKDILDANDGLSPAKLLVGQKILIPVPEADKESATPNPPGDNEQ